jgi:hypothetical protein
MLRFYIISCLLVIFGGTIQAQNSLADSLLLYEKKHFECENDSLKQQVLLNKIDFNIRHNNLSRASYNDCGRVNLNLLKSEKQQHNFLWNSALVAYLNGDDQRCRINLANYSVLASDTATELLLLQLLANRNYDTTVMTEKIKVLNKRDALFNELRCLIQLAVYERKHLNYYLLSSAIVPGSGTAMNGEPLKGLVSLAIAVGSVYGVVKMVEYGLYINTFLLGAGMGLKFYTGNIRLTKKAFERKELKQKNKLAKQSELVLKKIFAKYPLSWKGL